MGGDLVATAFEAHQQVFRGSYAICSDPTGEARVEIEKLRAKGHRVEEVTAAEYTRRRDMLPPWMRFQITAIAATGCDNLAAVFVEV